MDLVHHKLLKQMSADPGRKYRTRGDDPLHRVYRRVPQRVREDGTGKVRNRWSQRKEAMPIVVMPGRDLRQQRVFELRLRLALVSGKVAQILVEQLL